MFRRYRIGTIFGFPIEVNLSFLLMLGVVLLMWGSLTGVLVALVAFASVLAHELGHALVARHLDVRIAGIELHFFGGAAKMLDQPKRANDEILIAAAGPAVSFALGGVGLTLASVTGWSALYIFGWINLIIGIFNMVPALPMDGGRILRALLTRRLDYVRATEISITVSRVFAIGLAAYSLVNLQIFLLFMAGFLWLLGSGERAMARQMAHAFRYDKDGYQRRAHGEPDIIYTDGAGPWSPADSARGGVASGGQSFGWPGMGFGAGAQSRAERGEQSRTVLPGGFVIRRHNGRIVIEYIR